MVHSNASFRAMVTHDVAARAGLATGPVERADYGIEAVGRLGGRGRASAVTRVQVGDDVADGVEVAVFDVPQDEPVDGMLGLGWMRERGAVVDLGRGTLSFGPCPGGGVPLVLDDGQVFTVDVTVGGRPARFVVSTVAGVVVDTVAAARLGLVLGEPSATDGGPTGTVVDVRPVTSSWAVSLAGRPRSVPDAVAWDLYAYADRPRPASGAVDGYLGCEWLVGEQAVVDFGAGTLSLRP